MISITTLLILSLALTGALVLFAALNGFSSRKLRSQLELLKLELGIRDEHSKAVADDTRKTNEELKAEHHRFAKELQTLLSVQTEKQQQQLLESLKILQDSLQSGLKTNREELGHSVDKLTLKTDSRLQEISGQVEKRLSEGFEKTSQVFSDVLKRLALIDEAQKKITELSTNVVGLQEILADKRSRGAFGEVQLTALIRNMMPEKCFALQYSLGENKRADCILFLPEPTGNIVIDSKFPLEAYRLLMELPPGSHDRKQTEAQFRKDIKKHIQDIASKYIIPGETSDGAIMFIPAEAVFAEIHSHYPDLIELAHKSRVWLVSPTTLMAILTTARAVIKDEATREQVHLIQEHLSYLAKDFERFQTRMDALAKHIAQANSDVEQVNTSARKITSRFTQIEKVELDAATQPTDNASAPALE